MNNFNIKLTTSIKDAYAKNEIYIKPEYYSKKMENKIISKINKINKKHDLEGLSYISGNSNINFLSNNFHVKIKLNNFTKNKYEKKVIKNIAKYKQNYKFYGNDYVKKKIQGCIKKNLTKIDLINLSQELKFLHSNKVKNVKQFPEFLNGNKVLTHGDLRPKNIIFGTEVKLIDFEWSRINSYYWDLASVIINFNLNKKDEKIFLTSYGEINNTFLNQAKEMVEKYNLNFDSKNYYKF